MEETGNGFGALFSNIVARGLDFGSAFGSQFLERRANNFQLSQFLENQELLAFGGAQSDPAPTTRAPAASATGSTPRWVPYAAGGAALIGLYLLLRS